jgi:4-hydroxy-tetrahydrodipicolinate synthase
MVKKLHGIFSGIITPFERNGDIREQAIRDNVEFLVQDGLHGLVALAVAGEAASLSFEEKKRVIAISLQANSGRVPLLAGVGGTNARETFALIDYAEAAGVDGLFVITPYFYRFTRSETIGYFREISRRCKTQIMIYNSTYSESPLDAAALAELAALPNITSVKEGIPSQVAETIRLTGGKLGIFTSRDTYLLQMMSLGGVGGVFIVAKVIPRMCVQLYECLKSGDYVHGRELQFRILPLVSATVLHGYPAGIKAALNLMGLPGGYVRFPLTDYAPGEVAQLRRVMQDLKLL